MRRAWLLPHGATKTAKVPASGRLSGRSVLVVDQEDDEDDDASGMFKGCSWPEASHSRRDTCSLKGVLQHMSEQSRLVLDPGLVITSFDLQL